MMAQRPDPATLARDLRVAACTGGARISLSAAGCIDLARWLDAGERLDAAIARVRLAEAERDLRSARTDAQLRLLGFWIAGGALTLFLFNLYLILRGAA